MERAEIQVITVPVSDPDRAKAFSADALGWHLDLDEAPRADVRFIQVTPPRSASASPRCARDRWTLQQMPRGR